MDSSVVAEQRFVSAFARRYRVVLDLLHLGNRKLEGLVLGRLERVSYLTLTLCLTLLRRDLLALRLLRRLLLAPGLLLGTFLLLCLLPKGIFAPLGGLARGGASGQSYHHRQCR